MDVLGAKLFPRQTWLDSERGVDGQEMNVFALAVPLTIDEWEMVLPSPNMGTDLYVSQSKFFIQFAPECSEMVFPGVEATTR
jgi:hypothetical protein